ncbi:hypothetical protein HD554DRAFT_2141462 [Boletus coccyginus]|nr:hypothetical protein HD554DRAFT_2141462 [Boletus coccyginus]
MSRLIVKNLPPSLTQERLRKHFEQRGAPPGTITDIKIAHKPDGTSRQFAFVGFKTDKEAAAARDWFDRTFIDSARLNVMIVEGAKDAPTPRPNKRRRLADEDDRNGKPAEHPPPDDAVKETIQQTSRLFLRNLTFSCTDNDLLSLFRPFGEIAQVHIPLDPVSRQSKGLAYVTFVQPSSALAAYEGLDKKSFQGRLLHILPAVDRKGKPGAGDTTVSIKDERKAKRKATAGREFNWSMLYMNSDAVVSSIADRLSISKADILNPESSNAAVKLALAETHVIQETKSYLESQGVILSSFSSRGRSDTIILVKNIPYGTSADQIRELFVAHGKLSRVIVPPAGTMAVVEFEHAVEASKAFHAVAYRRLGNSVIYLEKGPLGMFEEALEDTERDVTAITSGLEPVTIAEQETPDSAVEEEVSLSVGSTLFVKNLAFSTTTERLKQVFRNLPDFAFARVQTKPDPKRPAVPGAEAPRLSMGYGFVGFKTVEGAKKALKGMQGFTLDGHALHVKFAGHGTEEDESKDKAISKSRTTKMIVKNVPFEATKKDVRELFGAHGQLKSVRLPKRFDARSRGFAFLEFVTRHEAENAYAALRHTHLLGRHLVLEWAEEAEQDLDALRLKAGVGYGGGAALPGRKRKFNMDDGEAEEAD